MREVERNYCARNAAMWLRQFPGKILVVRGESLVGAYDSVGEALVAGAHRVCLDSFLARTAGTPDRIITIPALTLGTLKAGALCTDDGSGRGSHIFPIIPRPE